MVRKTALVTAMLGAFASQTFAMGLGDIRLNSVLNQPLLAEVELLSPTAADLAALRVSLASNEAYTKAGVERAFFHTKLRFEVVSRPNGSAVIKITSREAVREPYLDFLLEATWGSGQVLREYTVLVDPPAFMPAPKPVLRAPVAATAPTAAPTAAPAPRATTSAAAPSASSPTTSSGAVTGEYTVTRSDTLWGVATAVRPDSDVSMEQTMLGLLEANPSAFYDQNINNLKAGYVLRVPSREEMTAISQKEALAETRRQNALWREGRTAQTKTVAAEPAPAPAAATADTTAATAAADAQLKLVAPETDAAGSGPSDNTVDGLRKDLALAVESVEAQRQENNDLNTRLKQLEDQLSQLHRMIELKDNQAAQLAGTATPATETPDAAVTPETATPETDAAAPASDAAPAADAESAPMQESTSDAGAEVVPEAADVATDASMPDEVASEPESVPAPTPVIQEKIVEDEAMPQSIEPEGLLESLMAHPMFKWAAGGGAVLIALLAWLGMRRSAQDEGDFQESILAERHAKVTAAAPNFAASAAATTASTPKKSAAEVPAKDPAQTDSSLFTDFAVSDMGQIHNDEEADPVAEADVYLAYGRYQQAEELIRSALDRAPRRSDLKLKLLEILFAAKNANSFDSEAEGFLASLGNPDGEAWQRVVEMGLELNPTNPLYGGVGAVAAVADETDSDLDFGAESSVAELDNRRDFAASEISAEDDNSLDFDLDSFTPKANDTKPSMPVEEDLSFDLSGNDMDDAGEGTLASSDEVATKLDLARAYVEMGDPEGARSILDEVMQEGNAAQKSEAQSLLKNIS